MQIRFSTSRNSALLCLTLAIVPSITCLTAQSDGTGTIEGRVFNADTGEYVERARITIEGTSLETFTDEDGNYRLVNVPAGTANVKAFFTGLPPQIAVVRVAVGQMTSHVITLASRPPAPCRTGRVASRCLPTGVRNGCLVTTVKISRATFPAAPAGASA